MFTREAAKQPSDQRSPQTRPDQRNTQTANKRFKCWDTILQIIKTINMSFYSPQNDRMRWQQTSQQADARAIDTWMPMPSLRSKLCAEQISAHLNVSKVKKLLWTQWQM